jgi:soluble lytic murein transglycosylase
MESSARQTFIRTVCVNALAVCLASGVGHSSEQGGARNQDQQLDLASRTGGVALRLAPTNHVPLPGQPSQYWLVPERLGPAGRAARREDAPSRFARGVKLFNEGDFTAALPLLNAPDLASTPVANYARYYAAVSQLRLNQLDASASMLKKLEDRKLEGYLTEAVPLREAEIAAARQDNEKAVRILEDLTRQKTVAPADVLMRLARVADAAGHSDRALLAYRRVYYEFPLSDESEQSRTEIDRLEKPGLMTLDLFKLELGRAERLFGARRWPQARDGFASIATLATGDDKEVVSLRLAECDYYLRNYRAAHDALTPLLDSAKRKAEARFFYLTATRALGDTDTYVTLARNLVNDFPEESWTEETLNNLASHYILDNDDESADDVFRELYRRFPHGRYAERAAWKVGWWFYKTNQLADAALIFDEAAAAFPRADTRPAWLYWAARAHDQCGEESIATERYRLVATDYLNSYYGRLASKQLATRHEPPVAALVTSVGSPNAGVPPTDTLIRALVGLELYDDALHELQYAQRTWGDSPAIQATYGWIYHQQGDLRRGINAVKRAYPQYLASGGEDLPPEVLRVLFPIDYWPIIKRYAEARRLDPYMMAALIAQESTFAPDVRSAANAYGLMQIVPATGRKYARTLGIRRFSAATLTRPEPNVRIGMAYFKDLVDRFGGAHYALASYNAGESRIARWQAERPGLAQDEFIDDIPFPETQNYVKKILGTAEDYRRLYGSGVLTPRSHSQPAAATMTYAKQAAGTTASKSESSRKATKKKTAKPATKPGNRNH